MGKSRTGTVNRVTKHKNKETRTQMGRGGQGTRKQVD